jgi:hypothetical protein
VLGRGVGRVSHEVDKSIPSPFIWLRPAVDGDINSISENGGKVAGVATYFFFANGETTIRGMR